MSSGHDQRADISRFRVVLDERPRCRSVGDHYGDGSVVPCDLHDGHSGKHVWTKPMTFEEFEWTDARSQIRPIR